MSNEPGSNNSGNQEAGWPPSWLEVLSPTTTRASSGSIQDLPSTPADSPVDSSSQIRVGTITPCSPDPVVTSVSSEPVQALGHWSYANTTATPALGPNQSRPDRKDGENEDVTFDKEDLFPRGNTANGEITPVVDITRKKKRKKRKKKSKKKGSDEEETDSSMNKKQRKYMLNHVRSHLPIASQPASAAITSFSSGPATSSSGPFTAPCWSSIFRSMQAPAQSTFGSTAFSASQPSTFASMHAPTSGSSAFSAPTLSAFGSMQGPTFVSSASAPAAITSVSTGPAISSGAIGASTPSLFGSVQAPSAITSVSTGPAQSLGPNSFGSGGFGAPTPSAFGSIQAPAQGSFWSGTFASPMPSIFGSMQAPVQTPFGYNAFPVPAPPAFGSMQAPLQGNLTAFGSFPAAVTTSPSSTFGQTNPGSSTLIPSSLAASSTTFSAAHTSGTQKPNEPTAAHTSGCTACGAATTSSSASGCLNCNGATTPQPAATSLSGLFFPTPGSCPVMLGTTPALQAYPVHGFVLLPFTSMNQR